MSSSAAIERWWHCVLYSPCCNTIALIILLLLYVYSPYSNTMNKIAIFPLSCLSASTEFVLIVYFFASEKPAHRHRVLRIPTSRKIRADTADSAIRVTLSSRHLSLVRVHSARSRVILMCWSWLCGVRGCHTCNNYTLSVCTHLDMTTLLTPSNIVYTIPGTRY